MSTIVFRDGMMAGDRAASLDDCVMHIGVPKIARDSNGVLYGAAGDYSKTSAVMAAIRKQAETGSAVHLPIPKEEDNLEILIAYPDGRIIRLVPSGEEDHTGSDYVAIGSGCLVALGALYAGADAAHAVSAACHHHKGTAGTVDTLIIGSDFAGKDDDDVGLTVDQQAASRVYQEIASMVAGETRDSVSRATLVLYGSDEEAEAAFDVIANAKDN